MKLNLDCIRDILISVESMEYGDIWSIENLINLLPQYNDSELHYHCLKLVEAGLLDASTMRTLNSPLQIFRINDLTYEGHQFLADIRSDNNWNKTKEVAKNIGSESLSAIREIATAVISSIIHQKLNL